MKEEIKEKWVKSLTNGEYIQGRSALKRGRDTNRGRDTDTFCCLGVLCDLYIKDTGNGSWSTTGIFNHPESMPAPAYPPTVVLDWAGIDNTDMLMLATHNDPAYKVEDDSTIPGHSFEEIAELIQDYL